MENKKDSEKFSYCVGTPWHPEDENSSICVYAYGSEVHHGTMEDAEGFKRYVEGQNKDKKYHIYKLVKVECDHDYKCTLDTDYWSSYTCKKCGHTDIEDFG